jgi:hypothetical protein
MSPFIHRINHMKGKKKITVTALALSGPSRRRHHRSRRRRRVVAVGHARHPRAVSTATITFCITATIITFSISIRSNIGEVPVTDAADIILLHRGHAGAARLREPVDIVVDGNTRSVVMPGNDWHRPADGRWPRTTGLDTLGIEPRSLSQ